MTQKEQKLSIKDLSWIDGRLPFSIRFDDTYYSKTDGRKETVHTFINGNNLSQRWPEMNHCTIGELGFGTGLNFLETARHWQKYKRPGAKLHFVSYEQFPMALSDMCKALSNWPELDDLKQRLAVIWNPTEPVLKEQFTDDIKLSIYFGDANIVLPELNLHVDAWYLDGFSPIKNPEMWSEKLMQAVFNNSKPGTTLATYTAASWVRRNLINAGFEVEKTSGFASKRDMTIGRRD